MFNFFVQGFVTPTHRFESKMWISTNNGNNNVFCNVVSVHHLYCHNGLYSMSTHLLSKPSDIHKLSVAYRP